MRAVLLAPLISIIFAAFAAAPADDEDAELLKSDFKSVDVVAHVSVTRVEILGEWGRPRESGGYTIYRLSGEVKEIFKGKFTSGAPIIFEALIEGQPPEEKFKGDFVEFLEWNKNEAGVKRLTELENSRRAAVPENLSILRKLRRR